MQQSCIISQRKTDWCLCGFGGLLFWGLSAIICEICGRLWGFYWALLREELTISLIYHMFNGRSRGNFVQTKIEPSLLELYWVQPKFKEFKCLASECKAKLAWTLPSAARHSKNLNFVQTKIEPSLLELYWEQPKFKEFKFRANEDRAKFTWAILSAAEIQRI